MRWRALVALLGLVAVVGGCAQAPVPPPQANRPSHTPSPIFGGEATLPPPDMTNDGPGSLVEVKSLEASSFELADATGVRIVYRSTSSDAQPTEVSGVVVVPPGSPPRDGWPIISFGHTVTGLDYRCAPSAAENLGGYAGTLVSLLQRGYVVAMSDYQGLGVPDATHSVIDSVALGHNIIDAARAARRVLPTASTRWAAFGTGEGGLAAWAAAELASAGDGGLDLVGAVALSPFADLSGLADAASEGKLEREQHELYAQAVQSLATSRAALDVNLYRSSMAAERWDLLTNCGTQVGADDRRRLLDELGPNDLRPVDEPALAALRQALANEAIPVASAPASFVPVLVVYGSEDPLVSPQWIERAVRAACAKGDPVEVIERVGEASGSNYLAIQNALNWVQSRFDGQRAGTCAGAR